MNLTELRKTFVSTTRLVSIALLTVLSVAFAVGQQRQPGRGFQFANSYASNGLDAVNVSNGNVMINLPIASLPAGRGTSPGFTVTLQYNSKLWDSRQQIYTDGLQPGNQDLPPAPTYSYTTNILNQSDRGGWKLLTGYRLIETDRLTLEDPNPCVLGHPVEKLRARWKMEVEFPDGAIRQFIPVHHTTLVYEGYYDVKSDGRRYTAANQTHPGNGLCYTALNESQVSTTGMHYVTTDGSRLRLFVPYQSSNWKIYSADGTVVENAPPDDAEVRQRITERNGGTVEIREGQIVDSLGRSITVNSNEVTVKGIGGEDITTQIVGGYRWVRQEYQATGHSVDETIPSGVDRNALLHQEVATIEQVILPNQLGGQSYTFDYYADTTQPTGTDYSDGFGELKSVTLPSGAKATYSYDDVRGAFASDILQAKVLTRSLAYTDSYDGVNTPRTETTHYTSFNGISSFTNPDGTGVSEQAFYYFVGSSWDAGLTYRSADAGGVTTERIWKKNLPYYTGNPYSTEQLTPGNANAFVKTEFTTIPDAAGQPALTATKDFSYDKNGNVTRIIEYDWVPAGDVPRASGRPTGVPASAQIKRINVNEYYNQAPDSESTAENPYTYQNPSAPKLKNVLKSTEIRAPNETPVSRTEFFYDDPNEKGNLIETRVWDSTKGGLNAPNSNGSRLYVVGSVANYISTTTAYDPHGNPTLTTDANGNQTQITYGPINGPTATFTGLYPTEVKTAYNTAIQQTAQTEYEFYTGQPKKVTALGHTTAENMISETVYDPLGRPKIVKSAVGTPEEAWTRTDYFDVQRMVVAKSDLFTKDDGKRVAIQHFDQLGRIRLARTLEDASTQDPANETHGIKVQTRYLAAAPYSYTLTSNPYRADYSSNETAETMGWTRSKSWGNGRQSEVGSFGAALPAPWGTNNASTGLSKEEEDANATTTTDEAGKKRRTLTDSLGRLVRVDEPDSSGELGSITNPYQPTVYSYDTIDNLLQIQQTGTSTQQCGTTSNCSQTRTFAYSTLSRLTQATNPESGTFQYTYTDNGNLFTKIDARGISTTYAYDALNRVTFRNYSDSTPDLTYTYGDPQIARSKGKLTKVSSSVSETLYSQFDERERVKQSKQIIDGQTYTFAYTYNLDDSLKTQTYPSGKVMTFGYDPGGDLSTITGQTGQVQKLYASQFSYTPHGQVEKVRLGNGRWETTRFNSDRQVVQIGLGHSPGNAGLWKINYEYGDLQSGGTVDPAKNNGNPAKQTITVPTIAATAGFTAVQSYTYDPLDRLETATEVVSGQTWKQTFRYDRFGNRRFDTASTTIQSTESAIPKVVNPEILSSNNKFKDDQDNDGQPDYLHDLSGNITKNARQHDFTYDAENRQITAVGTGLSTSYAYDGNGKRVKSHNSVSNQTTIFVYDADGDLAAEYTVNVPAPTTPTISYLTEDALGSVRVTTDSYGDVKARRDFLPFGEELWAGIGNRYANQKYSSNADDTRKKFATYQRDAETGLDFAQSRYYSPMQGRFTSPDEFKGGPDKLFDFEEDASNNPTFYADLDNPQSLNKYQYGYNNPLKLNDPSGHCPFCVGVLIGAAAYILSNPTSTGPREKQTTAQALGDMAGLLPIPGSRLAGKVAGKVLEKVGGKLIGGGVRKASAKIVTVSAKRHPEAAQHIQDAQKAGKPKTLTVNRKGANANRREALRGKAKTKGKDRDEYPPAFTKEGGKGSSVRSISPKDNRGAGSSIGRQIKGVEDGRKIRIKVVE